MNKILHPTGQKHITAERVFQLFKYSVYALLTLNIYHFFMEDYSASAQIFANGMSFGQMIQGFTATIDTVAWVILLLLFELETSILEDETIKGWVKGALHSTRALCYLFVVYSFYGYLSRYGMFHSVTPFPPQDVCSLVGTAYTFAVDMDEYIPWTLEICRTVGDTPLFQIDGTNILSTAAQLVDIQRLSITETVNSGNWLLIVLILEFDIWLQLRGQLTPKIMLGSKTIKTVLYAILFLAAAYWGLKGDFLDFGDAFLWIVAFIFIELNVFSWNQETREEAEALSPQAAKP